MSTSEHADPKLAVQTGTPATGMPVGAVFERMRFGRAHMKAAAVLFIAFVIEAWEMLALVYVASDVRQSFGIGAVQVGWLLSAVSAGMMVGVLVWGPLADRIGRKRTCTISLIAYAVCTLLAAAAPAFWVLLGLRVVAGLLLAGLYVITFPYFEELLPVASRGRAAVWLSAGWPIGTLVAIGATAALGSLGWRAVVIMSGLAGLWALAVRAWVPESPYWLVQRGRQHEARAVLRELGATDVDADTTLTVTRGQAGSPLEILRGSLGRITVLQVLLNFAFSWGYWGLQTWLPTLLQERGLSVPGSLAFVALSALFMIPGYASASVLTGWFGRKKVFVCYVLAAAAGGFFFAAASSMTELYIGNIVLSFFSLGAWGVWNTWNGEFYPTPLRGVGYSWGSASQLIARTAAPSVVGLLLAQATGFTTTVAFIDAFLVVTILLGLTFPETEGKKLD